MHPRQIGIIARIEELADQARIHLVLTKERMSVICPSAMSLSRNGR
jgi:hypothetical protein